MKRSCISGIFVSFLISTGGYAGWPGFLQSEKRVLKCDMFSQSSNPDSLTPPALLMSGEETFKNLIDGSQVFKLESSAIKMEIRMVGPTQANSGRVTKTTGLYYALSGIGNAVAAHGNWNLSESGKSEKFQLVLNNPNNNSSEHVFEKIKVSCFIYKN